MTATQTTTYTPNQTVQVSTSPAGGWITGRITTTQPLAVHVPEIGAIVQPHPDKIRPHQ